MSKIIYRIRFSLRLWSRGYPLLAAFKYPIEPRDQPDPIEAADDEIYYAAQDQ